MTDKSKLCKSISISSKGETIGAAGSLSVEGYQNLGADEKIKKADVFRVRFDKLKVSKCFSRGFVHVAAQAEPLQIEIENEDGSTTKIPNAWITHIDYTFNTNDWIILDAMKIEFEKPSDQSSSPEMTQPSESGVDSTGHGEDS